MLHDLDGCHDVGDFSNRLKMKNKVREGERETKGWEGVRDGGKDGRGVWEEEGARETEGVLRNVRVR